jgi:hypothetical protein
MEFIICSAIIIRDGIEHKDQPLGVGKGFIMCGRRHGDCYKAFYAIGDSLGLHLIPKTLLKMTAAKDMGFLTNTNRFVNRREAMKIAMAAGQLLNPKLHEGKTEDDPMYILTSEDLFLDIE